MQLASKHFDEYIMVAPGSDYGVAMWSDIKNVENAVFLDYVIDSKSRVLQLLHHIHFSFGINSRVQLPLQQLWKHQYAINKLGIDPKKRVCIIFTDISACRTDVSYLKYLHELDNVTMVMVLVNVMESKHKLIEKRLSYFDQVYSFDRRDCEKYSFFYYPTFYSITRKTAENDAITSDAFFVGVSKGDRHSILKKLFHDIEKSGGKAEFYLSGVGQSEKHDEGIHYDQWLSYKDVLDRVMETNCVVEIMGKGQSGLTLRAMEAIVYNKKLLTNNESVKQLPFYESGYIQYFEDPDDINIGSIVNREAVDYGYNGEFSPIHLIEKIDASYAH